ncbi:MAG TPA: hypothetical protein VMD92_14000 [Acidobacteriaceae bacterium]|nr:hypothetical protein [Acidobacteriaceae bacterium]
MAKLPPVNPADRPVEPRQQRQTLLRNAHKDAPLILFLAEAGNEPPFLQAIEQPRDIGIASDHALRDLAAEQAFGSAPQDTKNVVLRA